MIFSDEQTGALKDIAYTLAAILKEFPDSKNRIVLHLGKAKTIVDDVIAFQRLDSAKGL